MDQWSKTVSRRGFVGGSLAAVGAGWLVGCGGVAGLRADDTGGGDGGTGEGELRVLSGNGLPDHETGMFPNDGCPIAIRSRPKTYTMPLRPIVADRLTPLGWSELGASLAAIPLDPSGPYWEGDSTSGWRFEVMSALGVRYLGIDHQGAHVQPGGAYHYHSLGETHRSRADAGLADNRMHLIGWAADGFPIYALYGHAVADDPESPLVELRPSYRLRTGLRGGGPGGSFDGTFVEDYQHDPSFGDLDEANGRTGVTPEFPEGTYHYLVSSAFPFLSRFHLGTPDSSFIHGGDPGIAAVPPPLRGYRA